MIEKTMTIAEANAAIAAKIKEASSAIDEAVAIANQYSLEFHLDLGGYGMGGCYDYLDGWQASSQNC